MTDPDDVPSPIDFHDPAQARTRANAARLKRPWRPHFFSAFADVISSTSDPVDPLEIGAGPGHLARAPHGSVPHGLGDGGTGASPRLMRAWQLAALAFALLVGACERGGSRSVEHGSAPSAIPTEGPAAVLRITYDIAGDNGTAAAAAAATVVQRRLDLLGIVGAVARANGPDVLVELPMLESDETHRVSELISRRGWFTLHLVDADADLVRKISIYAARDPEAAKVGIRSGPIYGSERASNFSTLIADDRIEHFTSEEARLRGCWRPDLPRPDLRTFRCYISGRRVLEEYLERLRAADPRLGIDGDRMLVFERVPPSSWLSHHVERRAALDGSSIINAEVHKGPLAASVSIMFDLQGARSLAEMTRAHIGHKVVIVIDSVVISAPVIKSPITDGRLSLTLPTEAASSDADELATLLAAGALSSPLIESRIEGCRLVDGEISCY